MAKTKAEIEAEIARLRARLEHVEIDPAFTPSELVRWDPSLTGALLHIKHARTMPLDAFENLLSLEPGVEAHATPSIEYCYGASGPKELRVCRGGISGATSERVMENMGFLTPSGIRSAVEQITTNENNQSLKKFKLGVRNDFHTFTQLPLEFYHHFKSNMPTAPTVMGPGGFDLKCSEFGISLHPTRRSSPRNLLLPLANPDRFLLDQIFIATSARIHDIDVIIDRYPLSVLYQEWKQDMDAAVAYAASLPPVMSKKSGRLMPHHVTRPTRKTEFDKTKALLTDLQAEVQRLRAERESELSKQNERLRTALHVAANIPTNATNTTASSTDPV
jgi:hypothetical protein